MRSLVPFAASTLLLIICAAPASAREPVLSRYEKAIAKSIGEVSELLPDFREASPGSYEQAGACEELINSNYGQDFWAVHQAIQAEEEAAAAAGRTPGKVNINTVWDWDGKLSEEQSAWLDSWIDAVRALGKSFECDPAVADCEALNEAKTEQTRQVTLIQDM